jgi:putative ABC transport system permease protein
VVGVAGQKTEIQIGARIDDAVLIPSSTMRRTYNMGEKVGIVMFTTERGYKPGSLKPNIMRILSMRHPISPNDEDALTLMDVSEQFEVVDKMFLGLSLLALFVGAGTLMAGVIGVGNIMWVIVKERTQEIGIRRALGAKPRDIIIQILSESVVLTIVAGLAGICFAVIVLAIAQYVTEATFQLKFIHAIIIMMTFIVLGTLAGLIPAYKAMKIKPIEAINDK